jgi:hypothetical protein
VKIAILVTGDRHATADAWWATIEQSLREAIPFEEATHYGRDHEVILIHGAAHGIDMLASTIAFQEFVSVGEAGIADEDFPADWNAHGKAAGPIRNQQMLDRLLALKAEGYVSHVLAFHDSIEMSKGTRGMCRLAYDAGLTVSLYKSDGTRTVWQPSLTISQPRLELL